MAFQFRKEAIEEDLNSNFPSQGQGNPPLYYSLSEVVVPTYSINSVAEGSSLPENLQTAWDFSTGHTTTSGVTGTTTNTLITNTGFWQVDVNCAGASGGGSTGTSILFIDSGITTKIIWEINEISSGITNFNFVQNDKFVVFLRSGDSLKCTSAGNFVNDSWYRQIADVNGNLINPLGFSFA